MSTATSAVSNGPIARIFAFHFENPNVNLLVVVLVVTIALTVQTVLAVHWIFAPWFVAGMIWYAAVSRRQHLTGVPGIDAVVVSEQIIVCGIASLILNVVLAVVHLLRALDGADALTLQIVGRAASSFAEGLLCAGVAPVIAMFLRSFQARDADARLDMTSEEGIGVALGNFRTRVEAMAEDMTRLHKAIHASADGYEVASKRIVAAMDRMSSDIEKKSDSLGASIAAIVKGVEGLTRSLSSATSDAERLTKELGATSGGLEKLKRDMEEFGQKTRVGAELLDGLRDLIASVRRFIQPGEAKG